MLDEKEDTMNDVEKKIARKLVKIILAKGYEICVHEGEDWAIRKSAEVNKIMAALASTGEDTIIVRTVDGRRLGSIMLIWGNGEDLISDNTDNEDMNAIVAAVTA